MAFDISEGFGTLLHNQAAAAVQAAGSLALQQAQLANAALQAQIVEDPGMWRAIVTSWHGVEIYWHDADDRRTALDGAREAVRAIETGIFRFMARSN
jgi:stage V sporulation protein SpoVS